MYNNKLHERIISWSWFFISQTLLSVVKCNFQRQVRRCCFCDILAEKIDAISPLTPFEPHASVAENIPQLVMTEIGPPFFHLKLHCIPLNYSFGRKRWIYLLS